jgi:hypothetical protein
MKKAIAIIILGLLLSGNAYSKAYDVKATCNQGYCTFSTNLFFDDWATTDCRTRLFKEYVDLRPWGFTVIDTGEACRILDHN